MARTKSASAQPACWRALQAALCVLAVLGRIVAAGAQERPPGAVSGPGVSQDAGLRQELDGLRGRIDELGIELQRQERMVGALLARPGGTGVASADVAAPLGSAPGGPAPAPGGVVTLPRSETTSRPLRVDPRAEGSTAAALIVMVGNDGALTLEGRPAALPTLGYALHAAAGGDVTRRIVVGAEPKASAAQVGEVVSAVSQSGFGRITITGP